MPGCGCRKRRRTAFYDYYLARRQMEVNDSTDRLVAQFREIAPNKYQVSQATEQDVLQADVELANTREPPHAN